MTSNVSSERAMLTVSSRSSRNGATGRISSRIVPNSADDQPQIAVAKELFQVVAESGHGLKALGPVRVGASPPHAVVAALRRPAFSPARYHWSIAAYRLASMSGGKCCPRRWAAFPTDVAQGRREETTVDSLRRHLGRHGAISPPRISATAGRSGAGTSPTDRKRDWRSGLRLAELQNLLQSTGRPDPSIPG